MLKFLVILLLLFHNSFASTLFIEKIDSTSNKKNLFFNPQTIEQQIDSLNKLTPLSLVYNKTIEQHIKFYLFQRPDQVSKLLALSEYYFPVFEEILDRNGLPLELKYLPVIESSLDPHARSSAGAVGLWQFMYLTAKEYGLRINSYLDERKDIYRSTQAACEYLKKSYKKFQNWELAISSYNAGSRNITKAIRRSGGKQNYWELRPFLPKETRNYIPALIAAHYVMIFADQYGIKPDSNYIISHGEIDSIYLKEPVKIAHLAKLLDIDAGNIEELNPTYRHQIIPSLNSEKFPVLLPQNKVDKFLEMGDSIYVKIKRMELAENLKFPEFTDLERVRYKVKSGDYLGKIASKYNCTVKEIMMWNDLKTDKIKEGKYLNIYMIVK